MADDSTCSTDPSTFSPDETYTQQRLIKHYIQRQYLCLWDFCQPTLTFYVRILLIIAQQISEMAYNEGNVNSVRQQVWINADQELAYADASVRGRRFVFTHQVAAFFCRKYDVVAAILKLWRQIENSTHHSMRTFTAGNNPAKFHTDPIWRGRPNNKKNNKKNKNKMSSDMRSVPQMKFIPGGMHGFTSSK